MSFLTQPYIYPDPGHAARRALAKLIEDGRNTTVVGNTPRICIIGDSTSTCPGGHGNQWVPTFTHEVAKRFGNAAGSQMVNNGGPSTGPFGIRQQTAGAHPSLASVVAALGATNQLCPSMGGKGLKHSSEIGTGSLAQAIPFTTIAYPQGLGTTYGTLLGETTHYLEIGALAFSGSAEISYRHRPKDRIKNDVIRSWEELSFFETVLSTNVTAMGLDEAVPAGTAVLKRTIVGPFVCTTSQFNCVELHSDTAGKVVEVLTLRWLNQNPKGWLIDTLSAGGYNSFHWFGKADGGGNVNHGDCLDVLLGLDYDAFIFFMGTNDAFSSNTAASLFKTRMYNTMSAGEVNRGLVGEILKAYQDASKQPLIILAAEPFRRSGAEGTYATNLAAYNDYADKLVEIVDAINAAGGNAVFLNIYRATWEAGWNELGEDLGGAGMTGSGATAGREDNIPVWANATAYAEGAIVKVVDPLQGPAGYNRYRFKCVVAHTSDSATNQPMSFGLPWYQKWRPVGICLYDTVHYTALGGQMVADTMASLLFNDEHAPTAVAADVRLSTKSGTITGTLAVPPANRVDLDVPVDATVGTAILTAQAVADAMKTAPAAGDPAAGSMQAKLDAQKALLDGVDAVKPANAPSIDPQGRVTTANPYQVAAEIQVNVTEVRQS